MTPPAISSQWKNTPWATGVEQTVTVSKVEGGWVWYESELGQGFAALDFFVNNFTPVHQPPP